jgi:GNAT superfamily N-acetyltransferase
VEFDPAVLEGIAKRFRHEIWRAAPPDAVIESGVEVEAFGPVLATVFEELAEVPRVNLIQGAAEPGAVEDGHLADAIQWVRAHEVDYRVHVAAQRPGTEAAEAWLSERGYERGDGWEKFVRDTSPLALPEAPGIEILELGYEEGEGMDSIASDGLRLPFLAGLLFYDLPGRANWRCYVALLDGELSACGSMLIHEGVAELGIDATMESVRGRGCNRELLRRRLRDAAAAGCHTVFAEMGECVPEAAASARRNLHRAGFEEAYRSQNWQRPGFLRSGMEHGVHQFPG